MPQLTAVLAEAPFPVFGIRPSRYDGDCYVGDYARSANKAIYHVSLVYQHAASLDAGVCVSSVAPGTLEIDALATHLSGFVARFDPGWLAKHNKPRKPPFPRKHFQEQELVVVIAGQNAGAHLLRHKRLPLEMIRVPLRIGEAVTDIALIGWRADIRELSPSIERVDASFAREVDKADQTAYPYVTDE